MELATRGGSSRLDFRKNKETGWLYRNGRKKRAAWHEVLCKSLNKSLVRAVLSTQKKKTGVKKNRWCSRWSLFIFLPSPLVPLKKKRENRIDCLGLTSDQTSFKAYSTKKIPCLQSFFPSFDPPPSSDYYTTPCAYLRFSLFLSPSPSSLSLFFFFRPSLLRPIFFFTTPEPHSCCFQCNLIFFSLSLSFLSNVQLFDTYIFSRHMALEKKKIIQFLPPPFLCGTRFVTWSSGNSVTHDVD